MAAARANRNLLFGILALQNDFVTRDQLVAAMNAWVLAKDRPLGDLLRETGGLDDDGQAMLEAAVARQLARHGDASRSIAALSSAETARETLSLVADSDVQDSLDRVGESTESFHEPTTRNGESRYRVLRPHAKGGLGEVFVAEDLELHRNVALEEIQSRHADDADSRGRFVLEAEITGGLEHPGIVPVYGLGAYADGRPFYAMRFIQGDSLKEAIERFHATKPDFRSAEFRQLLRRFIDVCNAVAYAHSRGVLHRDLKPGNVMLGKFGETLVVDWGLAKVVGRPDGEPKGAHADGTLRPSSGSEVAATRMGSAMGTPAFMSPEQANGDVNKLGPATDVFSLGAILYALLTGEPLYRGRDIDEILELAASVNYTPPQQVLVDIPAALATICEKAVSKQAPDRYFGALDLAGDVERWLADEPVNCHRDTLLARVARWGRKHPAMIGTTGAGLITAVVALVIGLRAVEQEKDNTENALNQLTSEQARTKLALVAETLAKEKEANARRVTRSALDSLTDDVIRKQFQRKQQLGDEEKEFLRTVLAHYERFADEQGDTPDARADRAKGFANVGLIRQKLSLHGEAEAAFVAALRQFRASASDFPANPDHRDREATVHNDLGALVLVSGRPKEAEEELLAARDLLLKLSADFPAKPYYQFRLSSIRNNFGCLFQDTGRLKEAEAEHRAARDLWLRLAEDFPANPEYRDGLADVHSNLGNLFEVTQRVTEAETEYRAARELNLRLTEDSPTNPAYRDGLAAAHNSLGNLLANASRPREAEAEFRAARQLHQNLVADFPANPAFRDALARDHNNLGLLFALTGRPQDAEPEYQAARDHWLRLAQDFPRLPEYQNGLAGVLGNWTLLHFRDDPRLAAKLLIEARPYHLDALKANPRQPFYRALYRDNRAHTAQVLISLGRHPEVPSVVVEMLEYTSDVKNDTDAAVGLIARCIPLAERDVSLPLPRRLQLTHEYADQAMDNLRQAIAKGYKNVSYLKIDSDLAPLRQRDDFKKLLASLER